MRTLVALLVLLAGSAPLAAQTPAAGDGVALLVSHLEEVLRSESATGLNNLLLAPVDVDAARRFADEFLVPGVRRAVARERDRVPLQGSLPGDGYSLVVEFFSEIADHARMMTVRVDVRRPHDGDIDSWRIVGVERLNLVEGLFRLRLDATRQFTARNLTIQSEDLEVTLFEGSAVPVESDEGTTGLVLLGRGEMRFSPRSSTEKGQVRLFSGAEDLVAAFDTAYLRINPFDYTTRVDAARLVPVALDPRVFRRAREVFERDAPKSFNLDLGDLSSERWYLLPATGDFLADVRTRRFGLLTYARARNQAEDITLSHRERRRVIAMYSSADKLASRGPTYNEDELTDYDVLSYEIDVNVDPQREQVEGRARVRIRSRVPYLANVALKLADTLAVSNVSSPQFGRLLFLRIRDQNGIFVNLPAAIGLGAEMTVIVSYSGTVAAQRIDAEGAEPAQDESPFLFQERSYLLSNRAYWYPQNSVSDYATARIRIGVPEGWGCVASGQAISATDTSLRDLLGPVGAGHSFTFAVTDLVRYLAFVISQFERVADVVVSARPADGASPPGTAASGRRTTVALTVDANPRLRSHGQELATTAADVMRFYGTLMNDIPYASMAIAVTENELPGGHSPGYATMINTPTRGSQGLWRGDPAAFADYPEFFVAHELAHQWWGQAIGWKNYHEQWISESFSQYFSALYAQKLRGDTAFVEMLRQFRRWGLSESDQGPIDLGYRLGHIRSESRVFRALIYNKGASVLHMLRLLVGDEPFFRGLRRFYERARFKKTGTDEFQTALEEETGMPLSRFFERWIRGADIPRLRYSTTIASREVVVRFEQLGDELFDVPVTVTIVYANGRTSDVVVPVTEQRVERRIAVDGAVRQVQVNRDFAALAEFEGS